MAGPSKCGNIRQALATNGSVVVAGLFVVSCFLPGYRTSREVLCGGQLLLDGWLGLLFGIIGWYANLFFLPALPLFLMGKYRLAGALALTALVIGSTSLMVTTLPKQNPHGTSEFRIEQYGTGLYLWLASFLVLAVGAFACAVIFRTNRRAQLRAGAFIGGVAGAMLGCVAGFLMDPLSNHSLHSAYRAPPIVFLTPIAAILGVALGTVVGAGIPKKAE